ncbi:MAG: hypothetical protein ACO291_04280 [Bacteroidia bacterium]
MKIRQFKIEYAVVLFFLCRLIGITNPPLELSHNWRQVTGLMVARNFYENECNVFKPCTDETQGKSGIIGMEFPALNALHYLVAKICFYQHWYGRIINLFISSLGLLFFYKLIVISGFTEQHARYAFFFLAVSIWFSFSRKMMPDTFCVSLMLIAIFMIFKYIHTNNVYYILAFIALSTLAALSKIPAAMYLILVLPICIAHSCTGNQRLLLMFSMAIPLAAVGFWYFYWNPKLALEYGNWYNSGRSLQTGFTELTSHLNQAAQRFYFDAFSGYAGFLMCITGIILMVYKRFRKALITVILLASIFLVYILKSGYFFYHHNYYIIPFVPVLAFIAAYALTCITSKRIVVTCIIIICIEGILNQQHDFFIKPGEYYKLQAESVMNSVSIQSDKIAVLGSENPQVLYFSHRKGWVCTENHILDKAYWRNLYRNQCKFILVNMHEVSSQHISQLPFKTCYKNLDFTVLQCDSL